MSEPDPGRPKRSHRDLAVNGGPPAFVEPLHVGRPNVGDRETFHRLVDEVFDRGWLTNDGPMVRLFEQRVAEYLGVRNCVAMCNGTTALEITIRALGLTGEVILPSFTFVATAHALHWQGITPVFVDIDPATHNLDPKAVERAITSRTSGIVGVHLWGRPAQTDLLQKIADEHNLALVYDAAQAFASGHQGRLIGGFGRAEIFSFHATKIFNTFEGGATTTDDDELAATLRLMRNFGFSTFDTVVHPGINGKMTEVCAAMGLTNLAGLEALVSVNQRNYHAYRRALGRIPGMRMIEFDEREQNNYQYVALELSDDCPVSRDALIAALHAENVLARKYFWPGCHRMAPYRELFPDASRLLPHTERVSERVVVLPTGASVSEAAVETIASVISERVTQ